MKVTKYGNIEAPVVLIQMVDDHDLAFMESEVAEIKRLTGQDFCLYAFAVNSWNDDLSPWKAPAVFGKEDFGEGALETLEEILRYFQDHSDADLGGSSGKTFIIGGYSLAGLFALWAGYETDMFSAVAAASPSVWFPGFADYMKEHEPRVSAVYLSLGDKEEKTRNPVMATVGRRIREAQETLAGQGSRTTLEWNAGNHFKDADLRTAKAFAWAMEQL